MQRNEAYQRTLELRLSMLTRLLTSGAVCFEVELMHKAKLALTLSSAPINEREKTILLSFITSPSGTLTDTSFTHVTHMSHDLYFILQNKHSFVRVTGNTNVQSFQIRLTDGTKILRVSSHTKDNFELLIITKMYKT